MLWRGRSASSGVDVWSMFVNLVLNVLVLKCSVPCSTYRVPDPLFFDSDDTWNSMVLGGLASPGTCVAPVPCLYSLALGSGSRGPEVQKSPEAPSPSAPTWSSQPLSARLCTCVPRLPATSIRTARAPGRSMVPVRCTTPYLVPGA